MSYTFPSTQIVQGAQYLQEPDPTGESILLSTEKGHCETSKQSWKVWVPKQSYVVLGRSQHPEKECLLENIEQDNIPILKRQSGGGAVLLSSGCMCLSIRFSNQNSLGIPHFLNKGGHLLVDFLQSEHNINTEIRGSGDVCLEGKKILGCSLRMIRGWCYYSCVVAIEDIVGSVERYLGHPSKEPEYRSGRSHKEFMTHLNSNPHTRLLPKVWCEQWERYLKKQLIHTSSLRESHK
jgi:lipoate-protein ligase A